MPVLKTRNRTFAAQNQRRNSGAVAKALSHHLVEADARSDFGLRHRRAAEHVARLHAVDDAVVGLFVPQAAKEDQPLLPRLKRLQARPKFHACSLALRPPVSRVKPHAREGDQRANGRLIGGVGFLAGCERQRFKPRQSHRDAEPAQQRASRDGRSGSDGHRKVLFGTRCFEVKSLYDGLAVRRSMRRFCSRSIGATDCKSVVQNQQDQSSTNPQPAACQSG